MSGQTYTVGSNAPIQIFPAGQQGALTVRNSGSVTVYLSSVNTLSGGYPIEPNTQQGWNPGVPLYAYTASGEATILVFDGVSIIPSNTIEVASPVVAGSDFVHLGTVTGALGSGPVFDVRPYASVTIVLASTVSGGGQARAGITWESGQAGLSWGLGSDAIEATRPGRSVAQLLVKGPTLRVAPPGDNTFVYVFASARAIPRETYQTYPEVEDPRAIEANYSTMNSLYIPVGETRGIRPPSRSGNALLSVLTSTPTNSGSGLHIMIKNTTIGTTLYRDVVYSASNYTPARIPFIAPRTPIDIVFYNTSGWVQDLIIGLVWEG